jgi:hypothetical protein
MAKAFPVLGVSILFFCLAPSSTAVIRAVPRLGEETKMGLLAEESARIHRALQDLNLLYQSGAYSSLISRGETLEFPLSAADRGNVNFVALKNLIYQGYKRMTMVFSDETQRRRQELILNGVGVNE